MRIESLREPIGVGTRFAVVLDTGETLRLQPSTVADFGLYSGMELDVAALERLKRADAKASAKARAVRIISASGVSRRELRHRLIQKGETEEYADEAIEWLEELNLLDDLQTAKQLAQSAARKGYGSARIRQVLYQKGIDRGLWDQAMEELPEPDDAIAHFLESKLKGRKPDQKELKRVIDALMRRGYRWGEIQPVLRQYTDALDEYMED